MVKIITFGDFDILVEDKSIIEEIANSQRIVKLFKYFLVHKNIKLLPEKIIDDLWPYEEFKNPINMLRTQISRLRNILTSTDILDEAFFSIENINGYYIFQLEKGCKVDFVEFEKLLKKDCMSLKEDINENPEIYNEVILSYGGDYLGELGDEDWLVPIRSRYDRLYVKLISYYLEYLKGNELHNEILNICENAIDIKPYEEIIHLNFMEALIQLKQNSYALIHYEYYTKKLFNDLKVPPSNKIKQVYKELKAKDKEQSLNIDLNKIDDEMTKEFKPDPIMYCDVDCFKCIYNYERRNKDNRFDKTLGTGIGIITLYSKGYHQTTDEEVKKGMLQLKNTLFNTLRPGDVATKWNDKQMLILLYGIKTYNIEIILDMIKDTFNEMESERKFALNIKLNIL